MKESILLKIEAHYFQFLLFIYLPFMYGHQLYGQPIGMASILSQDRDLARHKNKRPMDELQAQSYSDVRRVRSTLPHIVKLSAAQTSLLYHIDAMRSCESIVDESNYCDTSGSASIYDVIKTIKRRAKTYRARKPHMRIRVKPRL